MLQIYLRDLLSLGIKPSWNNLNGVGGGLLSAVVAAIWPFDAGAAATWVNVLVSFLAYAAAAWIVLYAGSVIFVAPFRLWLRDRRDISGGGLEIVFDEHDPKFVRDRMGLYGNVDVRRWHVGVRNRSTDTNIDDVSLRAHEGRFVHDTIAVAHDTSERIPVILRCPTLAPGATDYAELFGLGGTQLGPQRDFFGQRHTFVLEARGRDTPIVLAEFEYLPGNPGTIRRL